MKLMRFMLFAVCFMCAASLPLFEEFSLPMGVFAICHVPIFAFMCGCQGLRGASHQRRFSASNQIAHVAT
jgi:hypothetical protein